MNFGDMIEIKDISGKTRFSTPINKGAKGKFTLMKEDYIVLPFSVPEPIYFKLGDYVDLSGVLDDSLGGLLSKVYEVTDLQKPSFNAFRLRKNTPSCTSRAAVRDHDASYPACSGVYLKSLFYI
jgi:hypothetical protein